MAVKEVTRVPTIVKKLNGRKTAEKARDVSRMKNGGMQRSRWSGFVIWMWGIHKVKCVFETAPNVSHSNSRGYTIWQLVDTVR